MNNSHTWDDIVVGAGSSGAVVASRLSEDSNRRVLLLEAGPDYARVEDMPAPIKQARGVVMSGYNWDFTANVFRSGVPEVLVRSTNELAATSHNTNASGQRFPYCLGKIIGGSSSINGAIALRGLKEDFDQWATLAGSEWSWANVLPFFRKLETDRDFTDDLHGDSGPVSIHRPSHDSLCDLEVAFWKTCRDMGMVEIADLNGSAINGFGLVPSNIAMDGARVSTALAYLYPARTRKNLCTQGNTYVERILFHGTKAIGVDVIIDNRRERMLGNRITLSAGAINSAAILLRSGIGNSHHCHALGIPSIAHLPGVGENLMDHAAIMLWIVPKSITDNVIGPRHHVMARVLSKSAIAPDLNLTFLSHFPTASIPLLGNLLRTEQAHALSVVLTNPASKGRVYLRDAAPDSKPIIDLNLLSASDDIDRLKQGIRLAWKIVKSEQCASLTKSIFLWNDSIINNDRLLETTIQRFLSTLWHPAGTAKMGPSEDAMAVVDNYCRVHSIDGLRVIDASIMPQIPSAPLNLSCIMLAERAAGWMT